MNVEIISVGTEILLGNIVNTNAAYLAEKCALLGLSSYHQSAVGDNKERLYDAVSLAVSRSDIVLLTGGLGPTEDDLTKEVVAEVFGLAMYEDEHSKNRIQKYFDKIHSSKITSNNWKQAMIPEGAIVIDNHNGTAPGIIVEKDDKIVVLMPGPPGELRIMFERDVEPYLEKKQPEKFFSKMLKVVSIGESRAETMILDLIESQNNPTIAPYAKIGEVHFRITAKANNPNEANKLMNPLIDELYLRFGNNIYTTKEEVTLEEVIINMLNDKELTLTTAESCTGGLLSGRLINVSGASNVYSEGHITYSNDVKEKVLGVNHETLVKYGAVSEQTAGEMAIGAAKTANADVAISITGIAGPDGGTKDKPVGLTYIGCYARGEMRVEKFFFTGNREKNRDYAVVRALTLLREMLLTIQ
ncbi:MAG: competence/damage-inducible protein A [Suipraeoptans sp.]